MGDAESRSDGAISDDGNTSALTCRDSSVWLRASPVAKTLEKDLRKKEESEPSVIDPLAEREKRYDALAEHFRRNPKLDVIYRVLDRQR